METSPRKKQIRDWFSQGVLLFVLVACVFPRTFFSGEVTLPGNLLYDYPPWDAYTPGVYIEHQNPLTVETLMQVSKFYYRSTELLKAGQWPLWNRLEFGGMPLLANVQSTVFYPPRLLHMIFDHYTATTLFILFKLWAAGMTAFALARGMNLQTSAARFFSVAWMLSGYNLIWAYWPPPDVSVWAPIVLLGVERIVAGRIERGFWTLTFGAVLILLAGHPETAFSFGLGIGTYFLIRLAFMKRRRLAATVSAVAPWIVAFAACAAVLLPFFEYLPHSHNTAFRTGSDVDKHFLPAYGHLALWFPRYFGTAAENTYWGVDTLNSTFFGMLYPGIGVFMLLFLVPSLPWTRDEIIRLAALAAPAFLGLVMAHDLSLLRPIQELPVLDSMWRIYYVSFPMLALPLIGAIALNKWMESGPSKTGLKIALAGAGIVLVYASGATRQQWDLITKANLQNYVLFQLLWGALVAASILICLAALRSPSNLRMLGFVVIFVTFVDLLFAVRGVLPTAPRQNFFPETELTTYLAELEPDARVDVVSGGALPGVMYPYTIEEHWGHDGIYPERIIRFYGRLGDNLWNGVDRAAGVTHYLNESGTDAPFPMDDPSRFEYLTTYDDVDVFKRLDAPRVYLAGRVETFASTDDLFVRMAQGGFDPTTVALTDAPPDRLPAPAEGDAGSATIAFRDDHRVAIDVSAREEAVLVLTDAYYPGWTASIDSQPAEIFPVYYAFRGVVVPKGDHRVEFRYAPASFRVGLAVSAFTLVLTGGAALVRIRQRKSRIKTRTSHS